MGKRPLEDTAVRELKYGEVQDATQRLFALLGRKGALALLFLLEDDAFARDIAESIIRQTETEMARRKMSQSDKTAPKRQPRKKKT